MDFVELIKNKQIKNGKLFLTIVICFAIIGSIAYRGVEQLAARRAHNPKVAGSSPAPATKNQGSLQSQRP